MAQKLTEQEQATVVALAKLLGKGLPAQQRGNAGGIASGLVRLRKNPIAADDVRAVIERYDGDEETLSSLVELGVLSPASGGADGYALAVPEEDGSLAATAHRDVTRAQAHRGPARSLSHLDCVRKQTPELGEVRRQIIGLDPRMWINGWLLSTPDAFLLYERELRAIDAMLAGRPALGDGTMSCRELSYRIFGDEKFLGLESDGRKLLHLMGISDLVTFRPQMKLELLHHVPKYHRHLRARCHGEPRPLGQRAHRPLPRGSQAHPRRARPRRRLWQRLHRGRPAQAARPYRQLWRRGRHGPLLGRPRPRGPAHPRAGSSGQRRGALRSSPLLPPTVSSIQRAMERFPEPLDNEPTDQRSVPTTGLGSLEGRLKPREADYLRAVIEGARLIPQEILTAADL